jgi:hypothetical protein
MHPEVKKKHALFNYSCPPEDHYDPKKGDRHQANTEGIESAPPEKNREKIYDRDPAPSLPAYYSSTCAWGDANCTCPGRFGRRSEIPAMPATISFAGPVCDTGISLPQRLQFIFSCCSLWKDTSTG